MKRLSRYYLLLAYIALVTVSLLYVPVEYISMATPFVGLLGSSGYLLLFSTRNWNDEPYTRALMLEAFTIWLLFLNGVIRLSITGRPALHASDGELAAFFAVSFNELILIAVWVQFIALFREIRKGYLNELDASSTSG